MQRSIPSLFGRIDGLVWVDDDSGDAPSGGLDILGVGLGRVEISDPGPIRESEDLLKLGKVKKAVQRGPGVLVRVVLDRPVDQVAGGHSSVHIATDIDGSRSNNAPTGVADPDNPFAGSHDVYSLTWASTTGKTRLLDSDLSRGWYQDKDPFAAAWAAPGVLDVLVAPEAFGEGFRVVSHVSGSEGGYDLVGHGPGVIPADGRTGLVPSCIEGSIEAEPFVVRRLVENGQTLRDVEASASWRGWCRRAHRGRRPCGARRAHRGERRRWRRPHQPRLHHEPLRGRRRHPPAPGIALALDGDLAYVALELGLTRRGYNVLRDIELKPTGDADSTPGWSGPPTR